MKFSQQLKLFLLVVVAGVIIYFPAIQDSVGWYNSGEFVAAAMTLDVPHAPGYPLYTRICNLGLSIPIQSGPALKVNLVTALTGIFAAGILFLFLSFARIKDTFALSGAFLLLFSQTFFEQSIQAEVYNLEILFILLGLFCGLFIARGSSNPWLAFFCGLVGFAGFGHRPTFGLYAISLIFFLKKRETPFPKDVRFYSYFVFGILVGLIPTFDLYLRLQNPGRVLLDPLIGHDMASFFRIVTGRVYSGGFFAFDLKELLLRFKDIVFYLTADLYVWPIAIALFLFYRYPAKYENSHIVNAASFLIVSNIIFVANYNAFEAQTMLLPSILGIVILASIGLTKLPDKMINRKIVMGLLVFTFGIFYLSNEKANNEAVEFVKTSYKELPPKSLLLLSNDVEFRPYWFLRLSEKFRSDLRISLVDKIETDELSFLNKATVNHGVFGTMVYPKDILKSLIASFSIENNGYFHQILPPDQAFKTVNDLKLANKTLVLNELKVDVGIFDSSRQNWQKGGAFEYFYNLQPSFIAGKDIEFVAYIEKSNGSLISSHGIFIMNDLHSPLDYICKADLKRPNLLIKRKIVIPKSMAEGTYKFVLAIVPTSLIKDFIKEDEICAPEGVTPLNWNGFLEVFRLKNGLSSRPLIGGQKFFDFEKLSKKIFNPANSFSFNFTVK